MHTGAFLSGARKWTNTRAGHPGLLRPEAVDQLLVRPVLSQALATKSQISTVRRINAPSLRVPVVTDEVDAGWTAEGDELPISDLATSEITAVPTKVGGVSLITRELAEDSSPEAQAEVGASLARVLAAQLDAAFFGNLSAQAPAGLGSLTAGTGAGQVQDLAAGTNPTNLDIFEEAISKAGDVGAEVTAFAMNPADVLFFSKLKQATGSNVPLLGSDPAQPRQRTISGVPVFRVPDLPAGTMYALVADRIRTVIRSDARVEVSSHSHFTSDRVAVKGTVRATVAFAHPQAIVRVRRAAS